MKTYLTRFDMINDLAPGAVGVEVGVQRGEFAAEMLNTQLRQLNLVDAWKHFPDSKDPADISQGGHDENHRFVINRFLKEITANRVRVYRMQSLAAASKFMRLDFVYLDARHGYDDVTNDLIVWSMAVKPGGCICGHDYVDNDKSRLMGFGVMAAVDNFCRDGVWEIVALTSEEWPSFKLMRK